MADLSTGRPGRARESRRVTPTPGGELHDSLVRTCCAIETAAVELATPTMCATDRLDIRSDQRTHASLAVGAGHGNSRGALTVSLPQRVSSAPRPLPALERLRERGVGYVSFGAAPTSP